MMKLCCEVLERLRGKTLATAESLTGGGIGAALTGIPGSSAVYKGGIISYCDEVKAEILGVDPEILRTQGAVSAPVAQAMAEGARKLLKTDVAVSVTGLAGPGGDDFGHPVGTVFIGYADGRVRRTEAHHFTGGRDGIRQQTIQSALRLILRENPGKAPGNDPSEEEENVYADFDAGAVRASDYDRFGGASE